VSSNAEGGYARCAPRTADLLVRSSLAKLTELFKSSKIYKPHVHFELGSGEPGIGGGRKSFSSSTQSARNLRYAFVNVSDISEALKIRR